MEGLAFWTPVPLSAVWLLSAALGVLAGGGLSALVCRRRPSGWLRRHPRRRAALAWVAPPLLAAAAVTLFGMRWVDRAVDPALTAARSDVVFWPDDRHPAWPRLRMLQVFSFPARERSLPPSMVQASFSAVYFAVYPPALRPDAPWPAKMAAAWRSRLIHGGSTYVLF